MQFIISWFILRQRESTSLQIKLLKHADEKDVLRVFDILISCQDFHQIDYM